jgi:valyl-tRNA synthetase
MSMRPQAHDIIRTWAFDTIVKVWMHNKTIPWTDIIISGHVLADSKEKLSKSKENSSLTPENLLATYSSDAIRYWTASGGLGQDVPFSENQLKIGQRLVTKLWNAFKFVEEHTQQIQSPKTNNVGVLNEWILHSISACSARYHTYFETHEMGLALQQIEQFFWNDFCDNYLELIKNQLFNPADYNEQQVAATRATLYSIGLRILQLYAPYIPHITDILYEAIYKKNEKILSIHQTKFATVQKSYSFAQSATAMAWIITTIGLVRKLKTEKQLSLKTELATLTIASTDNEILNTIRAQEQLIKGITQAKTISYTHAQITPAHMEQKDGSWHAQIGVAAP